MFDAVFIDPDLTTFTGLDELGLVATGQRLGPERAVLACRVVADDRWCHRCGCGGAPRDSVTRRLAHAPVGWRPTILLIRVRRYRCPSVVTCGAKTPPLPRHTRRGDKYVTVIIDLTPVRDGTGPARLLDMVEGRSKAVFKNWLNSRDPVWRNGLQVVSPASKPQPAKSYQPRPR